MQFCQMNIISLALVSLATADTPSCEAWRPDAGIRHVVLRSLFVDSFGPATFVTRNETSEFAAVGSTDATQVWANELASTSNLRVDPDGWLIRTTPGSGGGGLLSFGGEGGRFSNFGWGSANLGSDYARVEISDEDDGGVPRRWCVSFPGGRLYSSSTPVEFLSPSTLVGTSRDSLLFRPHDPRALVVEGSTKGEFLAPLWRLGLEAVAVILLLRRTPRLSRLRLAALVPLLILEVVLRVAQLFDDGRIVEPSAREHAPLYLVLLPVYALALLSALRGAVESTRPPGTLEAAGAPTRAPGSRLLSTWWWWALAASLAVTLVAFVVLSRTTEPLGVVAALPLCELTVTALLAAWLAAPGNSETLPGAANRFVAFALAITVVDTLAAVIPASAGDRHLAMTWHELVLENANIPFCARLVWLVTLGVSLRKANAGPLTGGLVRAPAVVMSALACSSYVWTYGPIQALAVGTVVFCAYGVMLRDRARLHSIPAHVLNDKLKLEQRSRWVDWSLKAAGFGLAAPPAILYGPRLRIAIRYAFVASIPLAVLLYVWLAFDQANPAHVAVFEVLRKTFWRTVGDVLMRGVAVAFAAAVLVLFWELVPGRSGAVKAAMFGLPSLLAWGVMNVLVVHVFQRSSGLISGLFSFATLVLVGFLFDVRASVVKRLPRRSFVDAYGVGRARGVFLSVTALLGVGGAVGQAIKSGGIYAALLEFLRGGADLMSKL